MAMEYIRISEVETWSKTKVIEKLREKSIDARYVSSAQKKDKEIFMECLIRGPISLKEACDELLMDRDVSLLAVKLRSANCGYLHNMFRGDKEIFREGIKTNPHNLKYGADSIRGDKDLVAEAVLQNAESFQYASKELRESKEFNVKLMSINGYALKYCSDELRDDRDVVLAAVQKNGLALQYASKRLLKNKGLVEAAIKQDVAAISVTSKKFQSSGELLRLVKKYSENVSPWNDLWLKETMEKLEQIEKHEDKNWMVKNSPRVEKKLGVRKF